MSAIAPAPAVRPGYHIGRGDDGLTARERQVLFLVREGLDQPEIMRRIGLTKQRIQQIRKALIRKGAMEERDDGSVWVCARRNS